MRQSDRMEAYAAALDRIWRMGLLYPCDCSRRDIAQALSAPQEGAEPATGPDGPVYPGTCRPAPNSAVRQARPTDRALRLDMARALLSDRAAPPLGFTETGAGPGGQTGSVTFTADDLTRGVGDVVPRPS